MMTLKFKFHQHRQNYISTIYVKKYPIKLMIHFRYLF